MTTVRFNGWIVRCIDVLILSGFVSIIAWLEVSDRAITAGCIERIVFTRIFLIEHFYRIVTVSPVGSLAVVIQILTPEQELNRMVPRDNIMLVFS